MRTITLEEHFATPEFFDGPARFVKERAEKIGGRYLQVLDRLCDVGAKRLAEMDAAGIDMQVLSLSAPGVEQMEPADAVAMARDTNDYLADAVKKHPTRFAGFAAVPTGAPKQAAEELERRVRQQGFKGAVINGHNRGRYLDNQFYWPILECAEALNVPIYLHPTPPPQPVIDVSYGGFSPMVTDMLAGGAWGWHIETAVHMIRIVCGGVFDRFPKLQFVIGHMGEGLPFFFQRLDIIPMATTKLKRPIIVLSEGKRSLHLLRHELPADLPRSAARARRRRPDHVLGRLSVSIHAAGARLPGANPRQCGRQGAHRARQCGAATAPLGVLKMYFGSDSTSRTREDKYGPIRNGISWCTQSPLSRSRRYVCARRSASPRQELM